MELLSILSSSVKCQNAENFLTLYGPWSSTAAGCTLDQAFFSLELTRGWDQCPGNSCEDRCGETYYAEGIHHCACDELCPMFRDCCRDFYSLCKQAPLPSFIYNHGHFKCLKRSNDPVSFYIIHNVGFSPWR